MDELNEDWEEILKNNTKSIILYFTASWCGPCKKIYPIISGVSSKLSDEQKQELTIYKIDIDTMDSLSEHYNIQSVPTFMLLQNNKEIERFSGADIKKLINMLKLSLNKFKEISINIQ